MIGLRLTDYVVSYAYANYKEASKLYILYRSFAL